MRAALYARVSTHDQQTLSMQMKAMQEYAANRGWDIVMEVEETSSGAKKREKREEIIQAARRREIDVILVWKLDRWGRSLSDLVTGLQDLAALGVGFVSITEALDFTTPSGKAMAGMLAVFAEFERDMLRERVKAGIAHARSKGKRHGRPKSAALKTKRIKELHQQGYNKSQIANQLNISRTSVRRALVEQ
ncbi:MAG: recombinase family protein [Lewinellaceae bacterium]|nr:recombinase family protein [Lewinellaceae bacterium]